jgi:NitT/TauT family transport system permease protein
LLPLVSSFYAVPLVILYPLLTAWIGIGIESKIVFGALYGIFPMVLATAAGVRTVDRQLVTVARSMGAKPMQLVRHVLVPAAVPSVLSGMRLGSAMTAIGVVVAEMMAATAGIGFVITQNRTLFNTANVYFGVLLVLVLAVVLDHLVNSLQRMASRRYPQPENKS